MQEYVLNDDKVKLQLLEQKKKEAASEFKNEEYLEVNKEIETLRKEVKEVEVLKKEIEALKKSNNNTKTK